MKWRFIDDNKHSTYSSKFAAKWRFIDGNKRSTYSSKFAAI
jgi:hypothetical protein